MRALLPIAVILIACACSERAAQTPSSHDRMFDAQLQGLEKAKEVGATLHEADQRRRAEEDAQTR